MKSLTKDEQYALGAAAICYSAQDDNLRDLSAADRAVALDFRRKAHDLLLTTGMQPTDLKDLGLRMIAAAKERP